MQIFFRFMEIILWKNSFFLILGHFGPIKHTQKERRNALFASSGRQAFRHSPIRHSSIRP